MPVANYIHRVRYLRSNFLKDLHITCYDLICLYLVSPYHFYPGLDKMEQLIKGQYHKITHRHISLATQFLFEKNSGLKSEIMSISQDYFQKTVF